MSTKQPKEPLLTTRDVMAIAGVSDMTVFNWRRGTASKDPLPVVQTPVGGAGVRNLVGFKPSALRKWADKNDVALDEKKMAKAIKEHTVH